MRETRLRSTEVSVRGCAQFLRSGKITAQRSTVRSMLGRPSGDLWIPQLAQIWEQLSDFARLGDLVTIHRGIEWQSDQQGRWSETERPAYQRGLHSARHFRQFLPNDSVWLDCREHELRGNAIRYAWDQPKLIANAVRLRRRAWCFTASLDLQGWVCSQQFFGLWPRESLSENELLTLTAILNGPVANAFLASHTQKRRFRISLLKQAPIPEPLPLRAGELVRGYLSLTSAERISDRNAQKAAELLTEIDASVLDAYDLPLRVERELLDYFRDEDRPVAHEWPHWADGSLVPGLTLGEHLTRGMESQGGWFQKVFTPLPKDEADALREYGA